MKEVFPRPATITDFKAGTTLRNLDTGKKSYILDHFHDDAFHAITEGVPTKVIKHSRFAHHFEVLAVQAAGVKEQQYHELLRIS